MNTNPLTGWDINRTGSADWVDWGEGRRARARILAAGDGYMVVFVEADVGYAGTSHEHTHPEFSYVITGKVRSQGLIMQAGGAYVATAGSEHTDFEALEPSTYISIFRLS